MVLSAQAPTLAVTAFEGQDAGSATLPADAVRMYQGKNKVHRAFPGKAR